jgi:hypothetical protein
LEVEGEVGAVVFGFDGFDDDVVDGDGAFVVEGSGFKNWCGLNDGSLGFEGDLLLEVGDVGVGMGALDLLCLVSDGVEFSGVSGTSASLC